MRPGRQDAAETDPTTGRTSVDNSNTKHGVGGQVTRSTARNSDGGWTYHKRPGRQEAAETDPTTGRTSVDNISTKHGVGGQVTRSTTHNSD